jgi:hypothetical protein
MFALGRFRRYFRYADTEETFATHTDTQAMSNAMRIVLNWGNISITTTKDEYMCTYTENTHKT